MIENIKVLISEKEMQNRIKELAKQIENDYNGEEIVIICTLKGASFFTIDLCKAIKKNVITLDFVKVSSYGNDFKSSGNINISLDVSCDLNGKKVIIIDDIIDSGLTLKYLYDHVYEKNPKDIKTCVMLKKKISRNNNIEPDYVGFEIDDKFIIGYGLDYMDKYRNIPYIGYID